MSKTWIDETGQLRSRDVFGIPKYLIPKEGLPVCTDEEVIAAFEGGLGFYTSVRIIEKTP